MRFIDSTGQTIEAHSLGVQPPVRAFRPAAWFWTAAWMAPTSSPSAGLIDAVGAHADVGVGAGAGVCFGSGLVDRGGGGSGGGGAGGGGGGRESTGLPDVGAR